MEPPQPSADFREFFSKLLGQYGENELPHQILLQFPSLESRRSLGELADLSRQLFATVHQISPEEKGKDLPIAWTKIALRAVASVQRKALDLFEHGKNPQGITLVVSSEEEVSWVTVPARFAALYSTTDPPHE